jgi:hypothetical protein
MVGDFGSAGLCSASSAGGSWACRLALAVATYLVLVAPERCVDALRDLRDRQDQEREAAGSRWQDNGLAFTTRYGTALNPANVRRDFRRGIQNAMGAARLK